LTVQLRIYMKNILNATTPIELRLAYVIKFSA
jgi:hypothetical protein